MSLVDSEAALLDLLELISTREGWGSKALLLEAHKIMARHRVSETFLERALRMYGGRVTLSASIAEAQSSGPDGMTDPGRDERRTTDRTEEVHDGQHHREAAAHA